ncbi:MAG TPA: winged helix-turn-helix domain-containing protein [Pseudonocardiaceae bacterium]|jgi:DNA-binding transcriptional ArsR family regulator|nr:winged helix-turn-helix domain-containing protein [Pseudonocardiaceae bacterium]
MSGQHGVQARAAQRRPATPAEVRVLASAVRLRIIRLTYGRALTNKEIAERLDKDPATTLYHVRKLVGAGFLEALPERSGSRGAREIPYLSTGLSWRLNHAGKEASIVQAMLEAFLGEVADTGVGNLRSSRLVMQLDEDGVAELQARVDDVLREFAAREPVPGGRRTAIYVALYPSE